MCSALVGWLPFSTLFATDGLQRFAFSQTGYLICVPRCLVQSVLRFYPLLSSVLPWKCSSIPAEIVPSDVHKITLTSLGYVYLRVLSCTALFPGHLIGWVGCSAWDAQATRGGGGVTAKKAGIKRKGTTDQRANPEGNGPQHSKERGWRGSTGPTQPERQRQKHHLHMSRSVAGPP